MKKKMKRSLDLDSKCVVSLNKYRLYEGLCTKISENLRTQTYSHGRKQQPDTRKDLCVT